MSSLASLQGVSFSQAGGPRRAGAWVGDRVVDIEDDVAALAVPADVQAQLHAHGLEPATRGWMRWLQAGPQARAAFRASLVANLAFRASHPLASVQLHAPLARPGKIVAIGRNYADHAKETGVQPFEKPRIISKLPSSVCDPGATVPVPADVKKMDFEAELAVVIGSHAHAVSRENAMQHVAAYCCLNDLSAREFQFDVSPAQTTFAKSMDGFCPLGPYLVDATDVRDPQDLWVRSWVNDQPMQAANTHDMLFPVAELIHYISQYMTLEPGDILATGTPAGIGAFRTPPVWLKRGDTIRVEVTGMGSLVTHIG
jgi:2-keto-4-pentenoate hydratase/2-oxohepta-3-ene-1,7-dioic acid hydratase in catechol pathway